MITTPPTPDISYHPDFFDKSESEAAVAALNASLRPGMSPSQVRSPRGWVLEPRLTALIATRPDTIGLEYSYSGKTMAALPPPEIVTTIHERLIAHLEHGFAYALVNLYRHGQDSNGWHADDEPEIGPTIASVSFGVSRRFRLRHNTFKNARGHRYIGFDAQLTSGSLLVMRGDTQHHWKHTVPKERDVTGERWNLTFRTLSHPPPA